MENVCSRDIDSTSIHKNNSRLKKICPICDKQFKKESQLSYHIRRIHYEEKNHVCSTCSKAFFKKSDLDSHILIHSDQFKCICKVCGRSFKHISNLNRHVRTHTGKKPYLCAICQKRFSQVAALQQHLQTEQHKNKSASHAESHSAFTDVAGDETAHGEQNGSAKNKKWWFYCNTCDSRFQYMQELRDHERSHVSQENSGCSDCNEIFPTLASKESHICSFKTESNKNNLNIDSFSETAEKIENSSPACEFAFSSVPSDNHPNERCYDPHVLPQTSVTSVQLTLTQNGQILLDNNEVLLTLKDRMHGVVLVNNDVTIVENSTAHRVLKNLSQTHRSTFQDCELKSDVSYNGDESEKKIDDLQSTSAATSTIACDTMGPLTSIDASLKVPSDLQQLDEKEKLFLLEWWMLDQKTADNCQNNDTEKRCTKFTCSQCGRIFGKKSNYQQHLGTHFTSHKKHECPVCGRPFAWKSTLVKHISKEHEERTPHACEQCPRVYYSTSSLQSHIQRDHLNIKPHLCSTCGKTFFRKYDLKLHCRKHNDERPYMCGICGKTFRHPSHVVRHERLHQKFKE